MLGATNVPNILDIDRVRPGTLIVDDSWPHCIATGRVFHRIEERRDILMTEGGALCAPAPSTEVIYSPACHTAHADAFDAAFGRAGNPYELMGCEFSSVLAAQHADAPHTLGPVGDVESVRQYDLLTNLGFRAADLYWDECLVTWTTIETFRARYRVL